MAVMSGILASIGRFATADGKRRGSVVHATHRPASPLSTARSPLQPHQRAAHRAKQRGCLAPASDTPPIVEPIRQSLQNGAPIPERHRSDQIDHQHGQGLGQPLGRQFGRGARRHRHGEG